jgi:CRISPR-associated protein Cmr1
VLNAAGTAASADYKDNIVGTGARYLGYGVGNAFPSQKTGKKAAQLERSCFAALGSFTVQLTVKPLRREPGEGNREFKERWKARRDDLAEVIVALKLLGLLGGLGARSRRGWGSLSLEALEGCVAGEPIAGWSPPATEEDYRNQIRALISLPFPPNAPLPPFTALSCSTRIEVVHRGAGALAVFDTIGQRFRRFRSWREPEKNFPEDRDWFKYPHKDCLDDHVPKRFAFAEHQSPDRRSIDDLNGHPGQPEPLPPIPQAWSAEGVGPQPRPRRRLPGELVAPLPQG